jgi:PKD repeat protein
MKNLLLAVCFIMTLTSAIAQRKCGTMEHEQMLKLQDPLYQSKRDALEQITQNYIKQHPHGNASRALITIPVVVHVVWYNASENISDAQINSQFVQLNKDYNKLNADTALVPAVWKSLVANVGIEFVLAQRDPTGAPTSGIIRKQYNTPGGFSVNNAAVKHTAQGGDDAWPSTDYLNIWICNLTGNILGYSQFPGSGLASEDGCVIGSIYFGTIGTVSSPYGMGRTVTHEVGHWLNLGHTFSGGCAGNNDGCNDTPPTAAATYGCQSFPYLGAGCSTTSPGIMFMNYMDYSDDACMYMFTNDQNARMQALFAAGGPRVSILSSQGAIPINGVAALFTANQNTICPGQAIQYTDKSYGSPTIYNWSFPGGTPSSDNTATPPAVSYPSPGVYPVSLYVSNGTDTSVKVINSYINVQAVNLPPLREEFETGSTPATWLVKNPDNQITWKDTTVPGGFGLSSHCMYMNNFSSNRNSSGQKDYLYTPIIDFSSGIDATAKMKFDYAYGGTRTTGGGTLRSDTLQVDYSIDCGATWATLWKKGGANLTTASTAQTTLWTPTATEWMRDSSISMAQFVGVSGVQFAFINTGRRGNAVYLDNVNIDTTTAVNHPNGIKSIAEIASANLMPNPTHDAVSLNIRMTEAIHVDAAVYDVLGNQIWMKDLGEVSATSENIQTRDWTSGIYIIKLKTIKGVYSMRLVKE